MSNLRTIDHHSLDKEPAVTKMSDKLKEAKMKNKKESTQQKTFQKGDISVLLQYEELFPNKTHAAIASELGYGPTAINRWKADGQIPKVVEYAIKYHLMQALSKEDRTERNMVVDRKPRPVLFIMFGDQHGIVDKLVKMSSLMKTLQADLHEKCVTFTGPKEDLDNLRELVKTMMDLECFVVEV